MKLSSPAMSAPTKRINLLRGWPSPDLLPASLISAATQRILTTRSVYTPILEYGPSAGHPPLRASLASWLGRHYRVEPDPKRICVTGGASQNIANILLGFSDPAYTRAVWVVAPCYYLACGIFRDAGFEGRMRAVPEDEQGIDVEALEGKLKALEEEQVQEQEQKVSAVTQGIRIISVLDPALSDGCLILSRHIRALAHIASSTDTSFTQYQPAPTLRAKPCHCADASSSSPSPGSTTPLSSPTTSTISSSGRCRATRTRRNRHR